MKRLLTVTILLFASLLYSQSKFDIDDLIDSVSVGLKYVPYATQPYTGKVFDFYDKGQNKLDGYYRKGLMNGKWTYYHEKGQIRAQGRFIDGDGSNLSQVNDIPLNGRTGKWKFWYENGKKAEENYKNGDLNGKSTYWYDNTYKEK